MSKSSKTENALREAFQKANKFFTGTVEKPMRQFADSEPEVKKASENVERVLRKNRKEG